MAKKVYLVFADDGHGANTPGKRTPFIPELKREIRENEFNKAVVKRMKPHFERAGVIFIEVAPTDEDTPLKARTDYANKVYKEYCAKYGKENVVAVYLSIHYNAFDGKFDGEGKDPEGLSVHIYPGSKLGKRLAECVIKYLKQGTAQKVRGIIENNFHVLRETVMPAILSENGFMDNKREALLMLVPQFQEEVAVEHVKGTLEYMGLPFVAEKKPEVTSQPQKSPSKTVFYRVIAGSFSDPKNAENMKQSLHKAGFKDAYIATYERG